MPRTPFRARASTSAQQEPRARVSSTPQEPRAPRVNEVTPKDLKIVDSAKKCVPPRMPLACEHCGEIIFTGVLRLSMGTVSFFDSELAPATVEASSIYRRGEQPVCPYCDKVTTLCLTQK